MAEAGYNPMRWDCDKAGCFNKKRRPKIELFKKCFPGKISFGDVDGLVEFNGYLCILEWKGPGGHLQTAQRITFRSITKDIGNIVFVVEGDAETMEASRYSIFWAGKEGRMRQATFDDVFARISGWSEWVAAQKRAPPARLIR